MTEKDFFKDLSVAQIKGMNAEVVNSREGLARKIEGLNPDKDALILIPEHPWQNSLLRPVFYADLDDSVYAGRKHLRDPERYFGYNQPRTQDKARHPTARMPWQLRQSMFKALRAWPDNEMFRLGISWKGTRDRDSRIRLLPLRHAFEGARIFSYAAQTLATDIEIEDYTSPSSGATIIGGKIVAAVPSRTKGGKKYRFQMNNLPVVDNPEKKVIVWNLDHRLVMDEEGEPLQGETSHETYDLGYETTHKTDSIIWQPRHVAAYFKWAETQLRLGNEVPLQMSPFPVPSEAASVFYMALHNNLLVWDANLIGEEKLRHAHIDEVCEALMLGGKEFGAEGFLFNKPKDDPLRDRKLRDYEWAKPSIN